MSQIPPPIPPFQSGTSPTSPYHSTLPPTFAGPLHGGIQPHRGGLILGLGIGSLGVWFLTTIGALVVPFCCGAWLISVGLAIPAWVMANADLALMNAGRMDPMGRGSTQAGKVCAIVSVAVHALSLLISIVLFVFVIGIFGAAAAAGAHHP